MERRVFYKILKETGVNIRKEYDRLFYLFYSIDSGPSAAEIIERNFYRYPFKGTAVSFGDFNETYNFIFEQCPMDFDINYLVNFCEYCYNLCVFIAEIEIIEQIIKVTDLIGYQIVSQENKPAIIVEKDAAVSEVIEIVPTNVAISVFNYNHHSLKGNIESKRNILKILADDIEPKSKELLSINKDLKSQLFYIFNNFNIRHNNSEGKNHNPLLDNMSCEELECIYDDAYQLWLLATLEINNKERMKRIKELSENQKEQ